MPDFPHLKSQDKFPGINNLNTFRYKYNFDYTRWVPGTTLKLCNVTWDSAYENVCKFADDNARDAYFDSIQGKTIILTAAMRLIPDREIKVPVPFDEAMAFNYLEVDFSTATSAANPIDYETVNGFKRFYFFIQKVEYRAPNATALYLQLDEWTTYINHVDINNMMLERGHAPVAAVKVDEYLKTPYKYREKLCVPDVNFGDAMPNRKALATGGDNRTVFLAVSLAYTDIINLKYVSNATQTDPAYSDIADARNGYQAQVNDFTYAAGGTDYSNVTMTVQVPDNAFAFTPTPITVFTIGDIAETTIFLQRLREQAPQFYASITNMCIVPSAYWVQPEAVDFTITLMGATEEHVYNAYLLKEQQILNDIELKPEDFDIPTDYSHLAKLYTYPYSEIVMRIGKTERRIRVEDTGYGSSPIALFGSTIWQNGTIKLIAAILHAGSYSGDNLSSIATIGLFDFEKYGIETNATCVEVRISGYELYKLHNYNANNTIQQLENTLEYQNAVESANTAYENAVASADKSLTNATASIELGNTNVLRSAEAAYQNALASNETAQTNANASATTSQSNANTNATTAQSNVNANAITAQSNVNASAEASYTNTTNAANTAATNGKRSVEAAYNNATASANTVLTNVTASNNAAYNNVVGVTSATDADTIIGSAPTAKTNAYANADNNKKNADLTNSISYTNAGYQREAITTIAGNNSTRVSNISSYTITAMKTLLTAQRSNIEQVAKLQGKNATDNAALQATAITTNNATYNTAATDVTTYNNGLLQANQAWDAGDMRTQNDFTIAEGAVPTVASLVSQGIQSSVAGGAVAGPAGAAVGASAGVVQGVVGAVSYPITCGIKTTALESHIKNMQSKMEESQKNATNILNANITASSSVAENNSSVTTKVASNNSALINNIGTQNSALAYANEQYQETVNRSTASATTTAIGANATAQVNSNKNQADNSFNQQAIINANNQSNAKTIADNVFNQSISAAGNTRATGNANATRSNNTALANAGRSQTASNANIEATQTVTTNNASRTQTVTNENAKRSYDTTIANATRSYDNAVAVAQASYNTTIGNAQNTRTTSDANAKRTYDAAVANAGSKVETDTANAMRDADIAKQNAQYTRAQTVENEQRKMAVKAELARAKYLDERNASSETLCEASCDDSYADRYYASGVPVLTVETQNDAAIAQAGDYFLRYGYAYNQAWAFTGFNLMPHFTYWKCSDLWLTGGAGVLESGQESIKSALKRGVTVWRDPDEIGMVSIYDNYDY